VNPLLERMSSDFQDENARYAYADSVTNAFISAQIKALREDRQFSQAELAALIGTKQSGVSRLEKADYSSWKIETLRKLARAFHVRLWVSFEAFGSLPDDLGGFDHEYLAPPKFEDDPAFKTTANDSEGQFERSTASVSRWPAAGGFSPPIEHAKLFVINAKRSVPQDLVGITKSLAPHVQSTKQTNVPESFTHERKTA